MRGLVLFALLAPGKRLNLQKIGQLSYNLDGLLNRYVLSRRIVGSKLAAGASHRLNDRLVNGWRCADEGFSLSQACRHTLGLKSGKKLSNCLILFRFHETSNLEAGGSNPPGRANTIKRLSGPEDYARDRRHRRRADQVAGLEGVLLTTDASAGMRADALAVVIVDIVACKLGGRSDHGFSAHH